MKASREEIRTAICCYADALNALAKKNTALMNANRVQGSYLCAPRFDIDWGSKYARIVRHDGGRSVHSFIDRTTGDILKAAGWRAPAKHARGSVLEKDYGFKTAGVSVYGVRYL